MSTLLLSPPPPLPLWTLCVCRAKQLWAVCISLPAHSSHHPPQSRLQNGGKPISGKGLRVQPQWIMGHRCCTWWANGATNYNTKLSLHTEEESTDNFPGLWVMYQGYLQCREAESAAMLLRCLNPHQRSGELNHWKVFCCAGPEMGGPVVSVPTTRENWWESERWDWTLWGPKCKDWASWDWIPKDSRLPSVQDKS